MDIQGEILAIIRRICPPSILDIDDLDGNLYDFGLDSLDLSGIYLAVEQQYKVVLDERDWERLVTVNAIADYVAQRQAG
jgi:acyl carrier protein